MSYKTRFENLNKVGEGSQGTVFKAYDNQTNSIVALKKIHLNISTNNTQEGVPATTIREASLLQELKHPNIVSLQDIIMTETKLILVFEFLEKDLAQYIYKYNIVDKMDPDLVKSYLGQILSGLHYCHSKSILHRDLKPQNLLIDSLGNLKIADFGLARNVTFPARPYTADVITLWYRAPEVLLGTTTYTSAVDIWSVACIFAELINLAPLFPGDSEIDQLFRIFRTLGTPSEENWPGFKGLPYWKESFPTWKSPQEIETIIKTEDENAIDLLKQMLKYNPEKRISVKEALEHPYFKGNQ